MKLSDDLDVSGGVRLTLVGTGRLWQIRAKVSRLAQDGIDPASGRVVLADEALGVDLEQHGNAVPRPRGDLCCGHSSVEPRRHCGVPEVIGPARQRGTGFVGRKRDDGALRQTRQ